MLRDCSHSISPPNSPAGFVASRESSFHLELNESGPSFFPVPSSVLLALPFEPLLSLRPDPKWKETLSQLALFALKSAWSAP